MPINIEAITNLDDLSAAIEKLAAKGDLKNNLL